MPYEDFEKRVYTPLPIELKRKSKYLDEDQFKMKYSETNMMRYIQRLCEKDVSLTNSMIPLGSCTMKLNSAVCMIPVTFHGFASLHPFVPRD
jgi:glycine dehydrogenase